jgi:4-amino-4-deoxy-L-arabinose transferase-like glycosyltransferase
MKEGKYISKRSLLALAGIPIGAIIAARFLDTLRQQSRATPTYATAVAASDVQLPREPSAEGAKPPSKKRRDMAVASLIAAMTIAAMLFVFAILNLQLPDPVIVLLVIASGLALAVGGGIIWQAERHVVGSRSNLGSALLAGAVVTFTVFGFQLYLDRQRSVIEQQRFAVEQNRQAYALNAERRSQQYSIASQRQAQQYTIAIENRRLSREQQSRREAESQTLRLVVGLQKDLTGIDLHGRDLSGFYLHGKNLTDANLSKTNLRGVDLRGATLSRTNLRGAIADSTTKWSHGFNPKAAGVLLR